MATSPTGCKSSCIPCSNLDPSALLSNDRVREEIATSIPLWEIEVNTGGVAVLSRKFVAKNFQSALDSINSMGAIAEREGHHPDFHLTKYRHVQVVLYTHKLQGVTENDLKLARMLDDEVTIVYSPQWLKSHPSAHEIDP